MRQMREAPGVGDPRARPTRVACALLIATVPLWGCTRTTELGRQEFPSYDAGVDLPGGPATDGGIDGPVIPILPDGGCHITWAAGIDSADVTTMATFGDRVIAGTGNGLFYSTDSGQTWSASAALENLEVVGVAAGRTRLAAIVEDGDGSIAYSSEDGQVWFPSGEGLPANFEARVLVTDGDEPLLVTTAPDQNVFRFDSMTGVWSPVDAPAGVRDFASRDGVEVAVSGNGTQVWGREGQGPWTEALLSPPAPEIREVWTAGAGFALSTDSALYMSADGHSFTAIALPPGESAGPDAILRPAPSIVAAFPHGVWRTDDGTNWTRLGDPIDRAGQRRQALASDGERLYVGTPEGVWRSDPGGTSLAPSNQGLNGATVRAISGEGPRLIVSTGTDRLYRSTDGGRTFTPSPVLLADAKIGALGRSGTTVFAGTQGQGVLRSTDDGVSFSLSNEGFPTRMTREGEQYFEIRAIAAEGEIVIAGLSSGMARSADAGQTWTAANAGLPTAGADAFPEVYALSTVNSAFFASTSSGLFRSTDGGQSWQDVSEGLLVETGGAFPTLGAVVAAGKSLFVAGNQSDDTKGPVVARSDDGGASWIDLSKAVPSDVVITGFSTDGARLYALFAHEPSLPKDSVQTSEDGTEWTRLGAAPRRSVSGAFALLEGALLVGTQGHGLAWMTLAGCP
ncbi:MAG: hypothetical protein IRZ16_02525 [Myxococcaceae bacterium]|nr:hypothetical protein [Myxococcaceae bacterium]